MSVLATSELPVFPKLDNTLGAYFVATYIGLMYVSHSYKRVDVS